MTATEIINMMPIEKVWVVLGGEEPRRGRARAFYRDGDNRQAVSLSDSKGTWFDHRDSRGGGVLDLVMHVQGGTKSDALRWLAELNGVILGDRPRPDASHAMALRIRRDARYFASAGLVMVQMVIDTTDHPERIALCDLRRDLRDAPMSTYIEWRDSHPHLAAALVHAGRQRDGRLQRRLASYLAREATCAA